MVLVVVHAVVVGDGDGDGDLGEVLLLVDGDHGVVVHRQSAADAVVARDTVGVVAVLLLWRGEKRVRVRFPDFDFLTGNNSRNSGG